MVQGELDLKLKKSRVCHVGSQHMIARVGNNEERLEYLISTRFWRMPWAWNTAVGTVGHMFQSTVLWMTDVGGVANLRSDIAS